MAGEAQDNVWPLPKFYFRVRFSSQNIIASFQEVSGLDIEFNHSNTPEFSQINRPGIAKAGNIILKKGIFVNDENFQKWLGAIQTNSIKRETVIIYLFEETGNPVMTWTLNNAWPTKITRADVKTDTNEIAIETLELSHESISIQSG